jgi:hypothetical protein
LDQVRLQQGFATVERERRIRIFFQKIREYVKIVVQIDRQVFIDLNRRTRIRDALNEFFCPAVRAAEVTVVSQDEVIVQEYPDIIRCETR